MKLVFEKRVNPGHTRYAASNLNAEIMLKLMRKATASKDDLVLMTQLKLPNGNPVAVKIISHQEVTLDATNLLPVNYSELKPNVNDETVTNSTTNVTNSDVTESPVEKTTASNAHSEANVDQDDQSPSEVNDPRYAKYYALCDQLNSTQRDKWTKHLETLRYSNGDFALNNETYRYDTVMRALNTRLTAQQNKLVTA